MNLQKGDSAMVRRPCYPIAKSAQNEEEKAGSLAQLELSYLHLVGDLPNL